MNVVVAPVRQQQRKSSKSTHLSRKRMMQQLLHVPKIVEKQIFLLTN